MANSFPTRYAETTPATPPSVAPAEAAAARAETRQADLLGFLYRFELVRVADLEFDPAFQRELSMSWAQTIADQFDPFQLDPILVSRRKDGRLIVLDGQHRVVALRLMGYDDQLAPCQVYENLTIQMEAKRFNVQSNRKKLSHQQMFRAALVAGDRAAVTIDGIVREAGFRIDCGSTFLANGNIVAVEALQRIYRTGKAADLATVLETVRDGLGTDEGPRVSTLAGLHRFHARYRGRYDRRRLVDTLRKMTQDGLHAEAADQERVNGGGRATGVARVLLKHYNARLGADRRLPEWDDRTAKPSA